MAFFLLSSMALVLLDQLQTFWQLCLIEFLGLFNKAGAIRAVALDISKAFNWVWHPYLLHQLRSYGISGQIFGLISSFFSNRWLWVVLDGKYSQKYPVNAGVPQGSPVGPTLFLLYINDLPDVVICNILIYAGNTTLYSKYDQASDCGNSYNHGHNTISLSCHEQVCLSGLRFERYFSHHRAT